MLHIVVTFGNASLCNLLWSLFIQPSSVLSIENVNPSRRNINIWAHRMCWLFSGNNLTTKCRWTNFRIFSTAFQNFPICVEPKAKKKLNEFHLNARGQKCGKCASKRSLIRWQKRDHNATLSLYCIYFTLSDAKCIFLYCTTERWGLVVLVGL